MHKQVIEFWFDEIEPVMWFKKDDDFDRLLHSRFGEIWRAAAAGELAHWRDTIEGRLAEVIVLDHSAATCFAARRSRSPATAWRWSWRRRRSAAASANG